MFGESQGTVRLLDAEPSLACGLERELVDRARETLVADVRRIEPGPWPEAHLIPSSPLFLGYLVLEGAFTREINVSSRISLELIGPGDLLRTWVMPRELDVMHVSDEWALLTPGLVAIIDEDFHDLARDFPTILTVLMDRVVARARWLGFQVAMSQVTRIDLRLLMTFRYAAERWGKPNGAGVAIPIRLSHRNLAALIGARRPKVSSAIGILNEQGLIAQRPDGTWSFYASDFDPMAVLGGMEDPVENL